jgi:hypothetical protein
MSNKTVVSAGIAGITAFLDGDTINFIVRTATATVRDSVKVANMAECIVAGRPANLHFAGEAIRFDTEKANLTLKMYSPASGKDYFWSAFEPIEAKPSMTVAECIAFNGCTASGKKSRAKKSA